MSIAQPLGSWHAWRIVASVAAFWKASVTRCNCSELMRRMPRFPPAREDGGASLNPHHWPSPQREKRPTGGGGEGGVNPGPVWPCLLLAEHWKMRPGRPHLALRSLVRGGPTGPGCGLGWPRQECAGAAKLLILFRFVPFHFPNPHPNPLPEGEGICMGNRDARFPPARKRRVLLVG